MLPTVDASHGRPKVAIKTYFGRPVLAWHYYVRSKSMRDACEASRITQGQHGSRSTEESSRFAIATVGVRSNLLLVTFGQHSRNQGRVLLRDA